MCGLRRSNYPARCFDYPARCFLTHHGVQFFVRASPQQKAVHVCFLYSSFFIRYGSVREADEFAGAVCEGVVVGDDDHGGSLRDNLLE